MATKTVAFTIKEEDLAEILEITLSKLKIIIAFCAVDPDRVWELREHDHYIYLNRELQEYLFSQQGAFTVAKYADALEEKSLWARIEEFVLKRNQTVCRTFVSQKVRENSSSLLTKNARHFLSEKDVAKIFCTTRYRLRKAFYDLLMSSAPMQIHTDFDEIAGTRYYSLTGIEKLSRNLATELKVLDRQTWCFEVGIVAPKTVKHIALTNGKRHRRKEVEVSNVINRIH